MAAWGLIVAVLLVAGSLPVFLGLAVVIPLLGHATWHLYRETIEPELNPQPLPPRAHRGASLLPISRPICSPGGARTARVHGTRSTHRRSNRPAVTSSIHSAHGTNDELSIFDGNALQG